MRIIKKVDIGKLALFVHELGNALAGQRYLTGRSKKRIEDYKHSLHNDAGAVFEDCVFGGIVGLRSGRTGLSREFR